MSSPVTLKEQLAIDEMRLDQECLKQPNLYFEAGERLADARFELDQAANQLSLIKAQTLQRIRSSPVKYGLSDKPTETAISGAVPLQTAVIEAEAAVTKARHTLELRQSFVTAVEHRKRSLTLLVNLHSTNWFAEVQNRPGSVARASSESTKRQVRTLGQRRQHAEDESADE